MNNKYARKNRKKTGMAAAVSIASLAAVMAAAFLLPGCSSGNTSSDTSAVSEAGSETLPQTATVSVGGVSLAGMNREQALQAVNQQAKPEYSLTLTLVDKTWTLTQDDLVFVSNAQAQIDRAFELAGQSSQATQGEGISLPVEYTLDQEQTKATLKELAETEMNTEPKDATVVSFDSSTGTFQFEDGKDGITVDVDKLTDEVMTALSQNNTATVAVPYTTTPFSKTAAQIKSHMQQLGTYSTTSTNTANGNHNMKLALQSVNGTVLQPGEIFSFNGTTGNTTNGSLGYRPAGAIVGGKLVNEYGGGICQASTTVYGAAVRSNMKILTRYNHAWPSTYCPIGQDAAVSYGSLDLRFQNTSEYPIYIVAGMSGTKLTVTFYGYQSPEYDTIKVTSQQTGTVAQPADVYKEDSSLEKGTIKKDISGRVGQKAAAQRIYYKDGVIVKREDLPSSYYRAQASVYRYGPGTDIPGSGNSSSSSEASSTISSEISSSSSAPSSDPSSGSSAPPSSSTPDSSSSASSSSSTPSSTPSSGTGSEGSSAPASSTPETTPADGSAPSSALSDAGSATDSSRLADSSTSSA